jgi:hypothetical protein
MDAPKHRYLSCMGRIKVVKVFLFADRNRMIRELISFKGGQLSRL